MSDPGQPSGGDDVQSALHTIIDSYGVSALSNEGALSNLLSDLLADNPREAGLLLLAAKADVAGGLAQRVQQGMDPATAVRMTASAMAESSPAAPEACTWVTTEVARALGHPVPSAGSLAPSSQPTVAAPGDPLGGVATDAPTVTSPPAGGVTTPGSWSPPGGAEPGAAWGPEPSNPPSGPWGPPPSNPPSGPWGPPSGPPPSNPPSGPWSPQPTSPPPQPGFGGPPLNGQPPGGPPPPKKGG